MATALVTGGESNRVLHAVASLLADLIEAPPEEIPARLRDLIEAHDFVTIHLAKALTATEAAIAQMKTAPFPANEFKRRTH
ncbi:MAG: hypothetical protein Q8K32_31250 [Archangium sp.]|nr:hypothetical protein [Archangium sp.]